MEYTFVKTLAGKLLTFNGTSWVDSILVEPLTKQNFIDFGISSINSITEAQWSTLDEDQVEFITWSDKSTNLNLIFNTSNTYKPFFVIDSPKLLCWSDTVVPSVILNIKAQLMSKFLFSKDGRNSWWTFKSGVWQQVLLSDIDTKGMTRLEVNNILDGDINAWFKRGTLDYAVYMYSESNMLSPQINNLITTYPVNSSPTISNLTISPDTTLYRTNIKLSADLQDLEGDLFQYKITINGIFIDFEGNNGWSDWLDGEQIQQIAHTYNYLDFKVGNNIIILSVKDSRGLVYSITKYLNMVNNNPIFSSILSDNWSVSGSLDDINGDKIRYRMLINGVQKYPYTEDLSTPSYTEYFDVPHYIEHSWTSDDLILNKQNTIKFEIQDYVGGTLAYSLNSIGKYKNLMFKDEVSGFYSDAHGNILEMLDFGTLTAGQTSDVKRILIENDYGYPVENTFITVKSDTVVNYELHIAKDSSFVPEGADTLTQLNFPFILQDGESKEFFCRITSDVHSSGTGGIFEIDAICEPV